MGGEGVGEIRRRDLGWGRCGGDMLSAFHFISGNSSITYLVSFPWLPSFPSFPQVMDPQMRTPVMMAFAAKLLVHNFIMSGGVWSTHVLATADNIGIWPTFSVSTSPLTPDPSHQPSHTLH